MKYIGLHSQISRNNRRSILLLTAFPLLILVGVYAVLFLFLDQEIEAINQTFLEFCPIVLGVVGVWFFIAYLSHSRLIQHATHAVPLERKDNMRVYNLTENLCMSVGMKMPKLYVIESDALNAYASGINEKTYAVTLTRGLIKTLNDNELEGVIAHELMHIRNKDVRLLIVTIVFVGIFGVIVDVAFRTFLHNGSSSRRKDDKDSSGLALLIILVIAIILYFLSMIFKFALSRSREYMADAGAVEMTKNAPAMASALRKVSKNSKLDTTNDEVKELFIDNGDDKSSSFFSAISNLFSTHPPIQKRIKVLEQF